MRRASIFNVYPDTFVLCHFKPSLTHLSPLLFWLFILFWRLGRITTIIRYEIRRENTKNLLLLFLFLLFLNPRLTRKINIFYFCSDNFSERKKSFVRWQIDRLFDYYFFIYFVVENHSFGRFPFVNSLYSVSSRQKISKIKKGEGSFYCWFMQYFHK